MSWVWEHSRSTGTDRLVLLAIADCASDDGGQAWPSRTSLARKAAIDDKTVRRAILRLVTLGELKVKTNAGPAGANLYRVIMKEGGQRALRGAERPGAERPGRQSARGAGSPNGGGTVPPEPSLNRPSTTGSLRSPAADEQRRTDEPVPQTAQTLVGEWLDRCKERPPQRVVGHVANELGKMLDEGIAYVRVRQGLADWHKANLAGRGLHPSALASFVHSAQAASNGQAAAPTRASTKPYDPRDWLPPHERGAEWWAARGMPEPPPEPEWVPGT
jgi:Helix-turn-helix domain